MQRPAAVLLVGFVTVVGVCPLAASVQVGAPPSATELLNRYDVGDRRAVAALLVNLPDRAFEPLKRDFEQVAGPWTALPGTADVRRRRLVAAALALEIVNARLQPEWKSLQSLIELGGDLTLKNPRGDIEHLWWLASVGVAEGSGDHSFTLGYLARAKSAFPGDPRFRFEEAVVNAFRTAFDRWPRDRPWTTDAMLANRSQLATAGGAPLPPGLRYEVGRRDEVRVAAKAFLDHFGVPEVRGEAHLRVGYAALILRDPMAAISLFKSAAEESNDPLVDYLAFFLTGEALDMMGRRHDAEMAYRQALTIIPNVQSGVEALASRVFVDGNRDEAYALVKASFEAAPHPPDVWRLFAFGDYARVPAWLERLRNAIS